MADVSRIVSIVFAGKDDLSKTIGKIQRRLNDLEGIADPFAALGRSILAIDAALGAVALSIGMVQEEVDKSAAKFRTTLGVSEEKATELNKIAKELFASNFGQSISENADIVTNAFRRLGDIGSDALKEVTENAIGIRDAFGSDVNETLAASQTLIKEFGLTSEQSFDFIVKGFQGGLNASGDFLESITEYSTQFSNGGADAGQFFSVLETGLQNGVLGTDKAADSFKEFRVRILDGSKTTSDALKQLGIDSDTFLSKVSNNTISSAEAFGTVINALRETDNEATRMQAGVGLLGTQFEDLGTKSVLNIDIAKTKIEDFAGATDDLAKQYDSFGSDVTKVFRTLTTELADLSIFDGLKESAGETLDEIAKNLPKAFDGVDFSKLTGSLDDIAKGISELFGDIDITSVEGLQEILQGVVDTIDSLIRVSKGIIEPWIPILDIIKDVVSAFNSLDNQTKETAGNLLGISQAVVTFGGAAAGILGTTKLLSGAFTGLGSASTAAIGVAGKAGLLGVAGAAGYAVGEISRRYIPAIDEGTQAVIAWADSLIDFSGTQGRANETLEEAKDRIRDQIYGMEDLRDATKETSEKLDDISKKDNIVVDVKANVDESLNDYFAEIDEASQGVEIPVGMSLEEFKKGVDDIVSFQAAGHDIGIKPSVDRDALQDVKNEIAKNTTVDIKPKLDKEKAKQDIRELEAKIKASADVIQTRVEWQAKLDIAEVEANAKQIESIAETITEAMKSSGDLIDGLFGSLLGLGGSVDDIQKKWAIQEQLEAENKLREEQLKLQKELVTAQVDYMDARTRMLDRGEALVNITVDSALEPALALIFDEIMKYTQVRATQEGFEGLLGF
jgi:phage-related minor tail protein